MGRKHRKASHVLDSSGPPPPVRAPRRANSSERNALTQERWEALQKQLELALERRQSPRPEPRAFKQLADSWLETNRARLVEPRNNERYIGHLKALFELRERDLTPRAARDALQALTKPQGHLSPSTVNKVRATGKAIIEEAQFNREWGPANPFALVKRLREEKPTRQSFTLEECRAFLPVMRPDRRREALFLLALGPRPGEEKALRKEDINPARRTVTFRRSNERDTTKTGRWRTVPVPDWVWALVEESCAAHPESPFVFPTSAGKRQRKDVKVSRTLRVALADAGFVAGYRFTCRRLGCGEELERKERTTVWCPKCHYRMHRYEIPRSACWYELRHSSATLHRQAGCDPVVIRLVLGHAARDITEATYTHLSDEYIRAELSKLQLLP